jgi:heme exporter protein B
LPFEMVTLTKILSHWFTVSLPLALVTPPLGLLLNLDVAQMPSLWLSMILGSLALSMLAGIGGAVTAGLRRGGLLASLLILPLYVPVLIFGVAASTASLGPNSSTPALIVLCAITVMSLVVAPWASAAALKAFLR